VNNLTQTPATSQAPKQIVATLISLHGANDSINQPTSYRLKAGDTLGTICNCPVDAIEIDNWPIDDVRIPSRAVRDQITAEYHRQGAQLYAEGIGIEYCANCHITDGYRAAQLAEVA